MRPALRARAAAPSARAGDLKLCWQPAVLRVAHLLAVDPHGACRVHAVELHHAPLRQYLAYYARLVGTNTSMHTTELPPDTPAAAKAEFKDE